MNKLSLKKYKYKIDLLIGGIPCQSYSQAGLRKGLDDSRGQLVYEFKRLIEECSPKIFMIENVKGLKSHNNGDTLKFIIELFSLHGKYNIKYNVLNSKDFLVPQKRERIIIVGTKKGIKKEFIFPEKIEKQLYLKDVLYNVPTSIGAKYPEKKQKIFKLIPPGGCWIDLPEDIRNEYMGEKMLQSGGGKRGVARKLSMEEQSLTLLTTPSQKQTERCHPTEIRPLNIREYARIQTFPDDYIFCGSMAKQYKQIGNAVPVMLAYYLGKQIMLFLMNS